MSGELADLQAAAVPTPDTASDSRPRLVIEPEGGRLEINWSEIWRYRELLYFLTWRDVKVRYKQTALGAAWAILQPLMSMMVISLFFGRLGGLAEKTGGIPYPIYVFAGLLPWTFFANAISSSGQSVVGSSNLITKVYFPRLIIPLSAVGAGLVDFAVSSVILVGLMVYYQTTVSWSLLLLPVFLTGAILGATGVGTLLAAASVAYRDFRYVVPFLVQFWMYASPVMYPASLVPEAWRWLYFLNPMVGIIEGFRGAFLSAPVDVGLTLLSLGASLLTFLAGAAYFRQVERRFADII